MSTVDFDKNINNLFNYFYNNNNDCSKVLTINKSDLQDVDTIKFTYKYRDESDKLISDILNGEMKMISSNLDEGQYYFKRNSSSTLPVTLVIGAYNNKNENINDLSRKENVEISISYLLSDLVVNNITKHIVIPINNVDVKLSQIADIINNYPSLNKIKEQLTPQRKVFPQIFFVSQTITQ